jgi:Flp pilus assembly protein TadD
MHKVIGIVTNSTHPVTPGKAVGYHFIPFFNLYWIFKWPNEITNFVNSRSPSKQMSMGWAGLFLLVASVLGRSVDGGLALAVIFSVGVYLNHKISGVVKTEEASEDHAVEVNENWGSTAEEKGPSDSFRFEKNKPIIDKRKWMWAGAGICLVAIVFYLVFLKGGQMNRVSPTKLVNKIKPAVVTVITYDISGKTSSLGSGFFVNNKGHLVTNYHVLKGSHDAAVKTHDGKMYRITSVISDNESADLAKVLVDIPMDSVHWIEVTDAIPSVAERVIVVGSPMGLEQTVSEGIVSGLREIPEVVRVLQISAPISQGSSGSPVINMKGQVIGVATFYLKAGQNLNFAIPGRYVLDLKHEEADKTISEWAYGQSKRKIDAAEVFYSEGLDLWHAKEHEKALHFLNQAIELDPNDGRFYSLRGFVYHDLGLYERSVEDFSLAIHFDPNNEASYTGRACSYKELGQFERAIEDFSWAIRIEPGNVHNYALRGILYAALDQHKRAIEDFSQVIRIDPDNVGAYNQRGVASGSLGRFDWACYDFQKACELGDCANLMKARRVGFCP